MYEIDFSPPPQIDSQGNLKDTPAIKKKKKKSFLGILSSKIVWVGAALSIALFIYGKNEVIEKYDTSNQERVYSTVEFLDNATLSKNYNLHFESDTAKAIYTIEYQNFALDNLKKILSLRENDINTIINVLPIEIPKVETSVFNRGKEKSLLISTQKLSSIQKYPIVANYALHFEGEKIKTAQAFFYTSDDFIIQDKLAFSDIANWHKKGLLLIDHSIIIFEANLDEAVIAKETHTIFEDKEVEILNASDIPNNLEKIVEAPEGEETEENEENLTAADLEAHEKTEDEEDEDKKENEEETIKTPEPKEVFIH